MLRVSPLRCLLAVVLTLGPAALAEPAVLLQPAIGTPQRVTLSGRTLKAAPGAGSSVVSRNLRLLTANNWEGATVEVAFGGQTASVTSGRDGAFSVTLEAAAGKPFEVGLWAASAHVRGATTAATVEVLSPDAPYFVISDFDDTLAVTGVIDTGAMLTSALGRDETTQPVVPGMAAFYGCLREVSAARPAFMLVSGSPIQYLDRVRGFLNRHGFPVFGIALRDLGPATLRGYKQPVLRALLRAVPNRVVFVGDSGEHDPEIYAQLRDEFPGRVAAIYIRDAGRAADPKRFEGMFLFSDPAAALADARAQGLASQLCGEPSP
jgi:phosphatidate phosphatase APP1